MKIALSSVGLLAAAVLAACGVAAGDHDSWQQGYLWGLHNQFRETDHTQPGIYAFCSSAATQEAAGLNDQDQKDWIGGCTDALAPLLSTTTTTTTTDTTTTDTTTPPTTTTTETTETTPPTPTPTPTTTTETTETTPPTPTPTTETTTTQPTSTTATNSS
jgi:hypothetical protein